MIGEEDCRSPCPRLSGSQVLRLGLDRHREYTPSPGVATCVISTSLPKSLSASQLFTLLMLGLAGPALGLTAYLAATRSERAGLIAFPPNTIENHAATLGLGVFLAWELMIVLLLVTRAWSREKRLRQRHELMTSVVESVNEGVLVADTQGRLLVVNAAARSMFGGTCGMRCAPAGSKEDPASTTDIGHLHPPADLPLSRVIRGEKIDETEIHVGNDELSEGGWASVTGAPIRDSQGTLMGGVVVFRDTTEKKRADELSRRLANAVEQTTDSVMITDKAGLIQYVNPAFEQTTGFSRAEAVGATPRLLRSGKQDRAYYRELWDALLAGRPFKATVLNRKKNGELFFAEQTITPMRTNGGGEITHFVSLMRDLSDRLRAEEQSAELRLAGSIQQRLFPRTPPSFAGYDVAGAFSPALATCGDYFDFIQAPGDRLVFAVADVCGHGLGPGLIMAATRGYLRSLVGARLPIDDVVKDLNRLLMDDLDGYHFVTMLAGSLDIASGRLDWANMGHPYGFLLDPSGAVKATLRSTCKPLGLFPDLGRPLGEQLVVAPGDTVVLFTDGVIETESPEGVQHGAQAALATVRAHLGRPASDVVAAVIAATRAFAGGAAQDDDITVVVVKRDAYPPPVDMESRQPQSAASQGTPPSRP